jgi:hypothetical protein
MNYLVFGLIAGEWERLKWEDDRFVVGKHPTLFKASPDEQIKKSCEAYKAEGKMNRANPLNYKIEVK